MNDNFLFGNEKIEKFKVVTYSGSSKFCSKCNSVLETVSSSFLTSKNKPAVCTHKKCKKCDINYIKKSFYKSISNNGKNPNVILISSNENQTGEENKKNMKSETKNNVTPRAGIHFVIRATGKKRCPKCNAELLTVIVGYRSSSDNKKKCFAERCKNCGIYYLDAKTYESVSENGRNPYVKCDSLIDIETKKSNNLVDIKKNSGDNDNINLDDVFVYKSINISCKKNHPEMVKQIPLKHKNAKNG